ncbi:hypothetical protein GOBAR_DD25958 [Gossypium barbadense]|nr:hypothetical protein GOBAR_DD25958 [Gossypium barbadense]
MGTTDANISSVMSSFMSFPSIHNQLTIKFTASNYLLWKTQFTPILHGNQLYVMLMELPLRRERLTGHRIRRTRPVLSQVVGSTTAIDAWTKLQTTYASGSRVQIRSLKNSLHSLARGTDSIVTYMDRAKRIYDQLLALRMILLITFYENHSYNLPLRLFIQRLLPPMPVGNNLMATPVAGVVATAELVTLPPRAVVAPILPNQPAIIVEGVAILPDNVQARNTMIPNLSRLPITTLHLITPISSGLSIRVPLIT